ncbi:MAG: SDR family NAD(P)-dependent oxidoreductase [Bryobacteraceae bacterium]
MTEFENRNVLITGASGGLGVAVVAAFLEAGANVTGVFRTGPSPAPGHPRFRAIDADLTTASGAARVVRECGHVDVLLHLVGGFAGGKPVAETDDETWNRMLNLNLNAAFYMARALLPGMLAANYGRIAAIASRTAVEPVATLSAYGASKAALVALVRTIALEVKQTGITANTVLPSVIDTPPNRAANPGADFSKWVSPESIARLLVWLASDQAADVNGAAIPVYGRA